MGCARKVIDSRYLQRRISQKFIYAKQLLAMADNEAIRESVSLHLGVAYRAWLLEIAHDRHHPLATEADTAVAMAQQTDVHIPAVLAECVQLEQNPESWLSVLLASEQAAKDLINKPPARALPGQIALVAAEANVLANTEQLQACLKAFQAFVDRYRESMQEC